MPLAVNVIQDASGTVRRRPGMVAWAGFNVSASPLPAHQPGTGAVIGMIPFGDYLVYVTSDRKFSVLKPGLLKQGLSYYKNGELAGDGRPSMIATRRMLLAAGGAQIQKWGGNPNIDTERLQNVGNGVDPAPSYPPPDASFISAIAQRLIAQPRDASGTIYWSGSLEGYENWDFGLGGASYIQAAAKPDSLVAIFDNTNEVFAFGNETIQVFTPAALQVDVNDPDVLLDFAPSRTQNIGTISPYSIVPVDDNFMMLDRQRRFITTDARSYTDDSRQVAQILRELERIDDCWGFRMRFGRFDCVVWFFPTDGFGLIYDIQAKKWSEWGYSNTLSGGAPEAITSVYNWSEKSVFLAGSSKGNILLMDDSAYYDGSFSIDSCPIAVEVKSGFTDHGTTAQKHCKTVLLKFKRTTRKIPDGPLGGSGHVRISRRDNEGAWKIVRDIELGGPGGDPHAISDVAPTNPCIQLRSLGVYRTRQWKIEYTGQDEIQLVSAQEEFEVLGA